MHKAVETLVLSVGPNSTRSGVRIAEEKITTTGKSPNSGSEPLPR